MKLVDLDKLLPQDVPAGETVLWHGRPAWKSLARRAWRVDMVAAYFAIMTVWALLAAPSEDGMRAALVASGRVAALGGVAIALLTGLAWLSARTTLYVVTTRRVVMKVGIALPIFFNIPFAEIVSAALRVHGDGTGDIPMSLTRGKRIAYLHLWPHARPFRFRDPEPALRCVPNATKIAALLADALADSAGQRSVAANIKSTDAPEAMLPGVPATA